MRYVAIFIIILAGGTLAAQPRSPQVAAAFTGAVQDVGPRFEFITLRRNVTGSWASSFFPTAPNRRARFNMGLGGLILLAYKRTTLPGPLAGAPSWLSEERYDMVVGGPFSTLSATEQQTLWRELLADRLKLVAHVEMRLEPSFDLMLAVPDRGLGPALKPAQRDCATPPPPRPIGYLPPGRDTPPRPPTPEEAMTRCGYAVLSGTLYSGGVTMEMLGSVLGPGRRVVDKTGVTATYTLTMPNFAPSSSPEWVARVETELGLKLVPSMTDVDVIVIDHIERPSDN